MLENQLKNKFDSTAYKQKLKFFTKRQIDSLFLHQLNNNGEYAPFNEKAAKKLEISHISDMQPFFSKPALFNNYIIVQASGSVKRMNSDSVCFSQIYSIDATYSLYGDIVSWKEEGLSDTAEILEVKH